MYDTEESCELLWGATYRIVIAFLETVFGFVPPDPASLPVISGKPDGNYLGGNGG